MGDKSCSHLSKNSFPDIRIQKNPKTNKTQTQQKKPIEAQMPMLQFSASGWF